MDDFTAAMKLYRVGRHVIETTADIAEEWFRLRIDREDLEEALLDLKGAVIDRDPDRVQYYCDEVKELIGEILHKLHGRQ